MRAGSPAVRHRRRKAEGPGRGTPRVAGPGLGTLRAAAKGTWLERAGIHLRCTVDRVLAGERLVDPAEEQPSRRVAIYSAEH